MDDRAIFDELQDAGRHLIARFRDMTPIQREAIPLIVRRESVLLVAPTATGKTEAALAPVLSLRASERWASRPSILYVAPTRALVNDLYRRLEGQLQGYLDVGRRTGEYREPDSDLLITTPESLDSMLARGQGRVRHQLGGVRAILLDELHLLAESARGAQLNILLGRLDVAAGSPVLRVALSATVSDCEAVARRFLGEESRIVQTGGGRDLRVQRLTGDGPLPERCAGGIDPLAEEIWCHPRHRTGEQMALQLLAARSSGKELKAIVFVPSRARCDRLAAELVDKVGRRSPVQVVGHHGSLSQAKREEAESTLQRAAESVAVATSTLELGIDIGDIRSVVLDGPPGSVGSLLQRVGRANRRDNQVHLMPFASSLGEACILASMIRSAAEGELDPSPNSVHLSVAIQQLASIFFQFKGQRLPRTTLEALWRAEFAARTAETLAALEGDGWLKSYGPRGYGPSEEIGELMEQPMRLHANIGSTGRVLPVVDKLTGEPVGWVPRQSAPDRVLIAGKAFKAKRTRDAIELGSAVPADSAESLKYATRRAPVLRSALRHLSLGIGLGERALVPEGGQWVHFGGALYAELLAGAGCRGGSLASTQDPRAFAGADWAEIVDRHWEHLESLCGFGPYHSLLPRELRRAAVTASVPLGAFTDWLSGLEPMELGARQRVALFGVAR